MGQRVKGSMGQRVNGSKGRWVKGSMGQRVNGSKGQWVKGSRNRRIQPWIYNIQYTAKTSIDGKDLMSCRNTSVQHIFLLSSYNRTYIPLTVQKLNSFTTSCSQLDNDYSQFACQLMTTTRHMHHNTAPTPEPKFLIFLRAQESIPRKQFRQPLQPGGPVRQPYSYQVPSLHRMFKNSNTDSYYFAMALNRTEKASIEIN